MEKFLIGEGSIKFNDLLRLDRHSPCAAFRFVGAKVAQTHLRECRDHSDSPSCRQLCADR